VLRINSGEHKGTLGATGLVSGQRQYSHFLPLCYFGYRGSVARIAVLFDVPAYRCTKAALVH